MRVLSLQIMGVVADVSDVKTRNGNLNLKKLSQVPSPLFIDTFTQAILSHKNLLNSLQS
jgi:hypothetical protein